MVLNKYESVVILKTLEEKQIDEFCEKYTKLFTEWGSPAAKAKIITETWKVEKKGVKKLAYEMRGFQEGYYIVFTFLSAPEKIADLERRFRIDDRVLKFITIRAYDEGEKEYANVVIDDEIAAESEQKEPETRPLGQNHYDFLFGYTDELK